jgi:hypothetical protein
MCYIHGSELGVHGKLRSANCLIDGRFVLKISDFGLHTLTTPSEVPRDATFYTSKPRKYNMIRSLAPYFFGETRKYHISTKLFQRWISVILMTAGGEFIYLGLFILSAERINLC